ncbi:uncharacterized protein BDR25DRAFT_351731 [Lindgomyces ingoldianus]|uniref:Uncharacterized protein n=1 Tax=Lindgomyces ingoldianus TaxID=673940 RepID=A0ACB6R537_9PLEO|nr:uncharacterized protein BDR25DRAFT_351731 [Lindgomyces ingoldianus]KAF2474195.1 hypothetical protein BDR25DRAFT_351731 [Lindgomyces ingoldianus]
MTPAPNHVLSLTVFGEKIVAGSLPKSGRDKILIVEIILWSLSGHANPKWTCLLMKCLCIVPSRVKKTQAKFVLDMLRGVFGHRIHENEPHAIDHDLSPHRHKPQRSPSNPIHICRQAHLISSTSPYSSGFPISYLSVTLLYLSFKSTQLDHFNFINKHFERLVLRLQYWTFLN